MENALKIRNILFKCFIINYIVIVLVWGVSFSNFFPYMMEKFFLFGPEETARYFAFMLGFWKIINAIFFLVPAIAIHWEYAGKKQKKTAKRK